MKTKVQTSEMEKLVYKMITENTGTHFLDSGFENGRMWQKNQKKTIVDFMNEPEETYILDRRFKEIERSVSVFHFLNGLELDEICDGFNRRNTNAKEWEGEYYGMSKHAWNWLEKTYEPEFVREVNTYNYNSDLSQVLQWVELDIFVDGQTQRYYSMQIHNGADVRGGYTDAKLFKANYCSGGIHEYLQDYKSQSEIVDDLKEGYLTVYDYETNEVIPNDEVLSLLEAE